MKFLYLGKLIVHYYINTESTLYAARIAVYLIMFTHNNKIIIPLLVHIAFVKLIPNLGCVYLSV